MSIVRTSLLLVCVFGADACLATEDAFPVQGQGASFMPVGHRVPDLLSGNAVAADFLVEESGSLGVAVDAGKLQELRGGESTVDNQVLIDGTVGANVADDLVTGSNAINGDAFANTSGISTVIQNTGNNVLIQNGMVVNVQFVGP